MVDSERYLLTVYRYIELNPVRANMVSHAAEYPWSSYQYNAVGKPIRLITPHIAYQTLGECDENRQKNYRALFKGRMRDTDIQEIRDATNKAWILGSDRFKAQFLAATGRSGLPVGRGGDRKSNEYALTKKQ